VKYGLARLGRCDGSVRLPLVEPKEESKQAIEQAMVLAGLIN